MLSEITQTPKETPVSLMQNLDGQMKYSKRKGRTVNGRGIMIPLHVETRFNICMHIYDMEAEVKLSGGGRKPEAGVGNEGWVR